MIEKWHATLNGGRHTHVVLLHQQFDKVRLNVGVEQPLQDFSFGMVPVRKNMLVSGPAWELLQGLIGKQSCLLGFPECGEKIIEIERTP